MALELRANPTASTILEVERILEKERRGAGAPLSLSEIARRMSAKKTRLESVRAAVEALVHFEVAAVGPHGVIFTRAPSKPTGTTATAKQLYRANKASVDAVLQRHGVRHLVAFGSRARGNARPDSDLDLAADLPPKMTLFDMGGLQADLEDAFGLPVDLVSLRALRPRMAAVVKSEGVTLA